MCFWEDIVQKARTSRGLLEHDRLKVIRIDGNYLKSSKIDTSKPFNITCRVLTLDVLSGHVYRDYACGIKEKKLLNPHARSYPTCTHVTLSYDTLTGTDRFTS